MKSPVTENGREKVNTLFIVEASRRLDKDTNERKKMSAPPAIDQKATARQIKKYMDRLGLKPADIQRYLGLTCVQTVYRWFDGTNIPTIDHLYALSWLFGVKIDDMIISMKEESVKRIEYRNLRWILCYCKRWIVHREGS